MDDTPDPLLQFFSTKEIDEADILYSTLHVPASATAEEIRKAYRKLALRYHPDKHSAKSDQVKADASNEFQKIGFAYAVLSDEARRKRYDATGRTDENAFADAESMGWDAYFESLFQRIDRKLLDEDKKKYQGSTDEQEDLIEAYNSTRGSLPGILDHIPHSDTSDEPRLIKAINKLISKGTLKSNKEWKSSSEDTKGKEKRAKKAEKEAAEAEKAAKDLDVWDEFYGSGKKGKRKGEKEEESGLAALILKRQKQRSGALDSLADKYARIEEEDRESKKAKRGKKGKAGVDVEIAEPPPISDADFEALQAKMFGDATKGKKAKA